MNGTTWLDRTNYFETMPSHQLELALWLEADRMGDAARRAEPGEPRQPARGRQEREALVVRQPARTAPGTRSSRRTSSRPSTRTTTRRSGRWRTSTRRRSTTSRRSSGPTTRRTTRSCRSSATSIRRRPGAGPSATSAASRPTRPSRRCGDLSLPPTLGGERPRDRPRPRPAAAGLLRVPRAGVRRPAARRARRRRPDPGRRQGQPAPSPARPRRADRPGRRRCSRLGFIGGASICAGWATVRPGVPIERVEAVVPRGARPARSRARSPTTSSLGPTR